MRGPYNFPSGNRTLIPSFVDCLLMQGELIVQKWPIVTESAMALSGGPGKILVGVVNMG